MKLKEFRTCYLSFVNLYGAIHSDYAFQIMKKYFPSLTKKEMYKDMKSRYEKYTREYEIIKTTDNKYVVKAVYLTYENLDKLFDSQGDKPFFIPETFEELERYSNSSYWLDDFENIINRFITFISRFMESDDEKKTSRRILSLIYTIRIYVESLDILDFGKYIDLLDKYKIKIDKEEDIKAYLDYITLFNNYSKHISNRGYSPNELKELIGGVDKENVKLTLGPNIKKRLLEDPGAAEEYLEMIKNSDIPNVAKHSLITEVNEIIEQVKENLIKS